MHGTWRSLTAILGLAAGLCAGAGQSVAAAELPVAELEEIEQHLAQLNFDPGQIDGVVDDRTRTAIRLYQEFAVLPVDGEPSAKLLAELRQVSQAFAEMRAASPAVTEVAPEPASEPEAAAPESQAAVAEPAVAAPEPEAAASEPEVVAPEPEAAAPESQAAVAEPEVAVPEPQVADAAPASSTPEAEPAPAAETAMSAPAAELPPLDSVAKAAEPSPPPTPSADVPAADVAATESPAPAVPAPPQSPPVAEPQTVKLESPPEPAPAVESDKAEPQKAEPEKVESGKADGFSIESMIARLKQIGDPATLARPAPAQPAATAPATDAAGYQRTMIWRAQNELKRIGIDPGPADGNLRARTTYAIETYQRARGLPVDGRISEQLLARLEAETAPAAPAPSNTAPLESIAPQSAAISPVPQNGYQAFRAGYSAAQTGDFDTAIKLYDRAVDSGDLALEHLAAALYNRANALQYLGVLDKAIDDYSAAIANKPGFPAAYYNRGFAFDSKGEQLRAVEDYRKARDLGLQRLGVRSPDVPPPQL